MNLPRLHRDHFTFQCLVPETSGVCWPAAAGLIYLRQLLVLPEQVSLEGSSCCINNDLRRNPLVQAIVSASKLSPTRTMACGISLRGVVKREGHHELQFSYAAFHPRNGSLFGWSEDLDVGVNRKHAPPSLRPRLDADRLFVFDEAQLERLSSAARPALPAG